MNARPAKLSEGGGGKFNNIDGTITDYEFTTVHPFAKEGQRRKSDFNPLFGVLTATMDGATEPDVDVLLVGSADDFEVSDDGKTITPANEGDGIWSKSQWGKLIASMEKAGIATENADYPEGTYNYEPIIGRRVRFMQEQQFDKHGKLKTRKGKGRDGKPRDYDDTTTIVVADYGTTPAVRSVGKGQTTGKVATTTKAAKGKSNGKAIEVDLTDVADEALLKVLAKFGGTAPKTKLVSAQAQLLLKKDYPDDSDSIRRMLYDDDYLSGAVERGLIAFDQASKAQTIAAV